MVTLPLWIVVLGGIALAYIALVLACLLACRALGISIFPSAERRRGFVCRLAPPPDQSVGKQQERDAPSDPKRNPVLTGDLSAHERKDSTFRVLRDFAERNALHIALSSMVDGAGQICCVYCGCHLDGSPHEDDCPVPYAEAVLRGGYPVPEVEKETDDA